MFCKGLFFKKSFYFSTYRVKSICCKEIFGRKLGRLEIFVFYRSTFYIPLTQTYIKSHNSIMKRNRRFTMTPELEQMFCIDDARGETTKVMLRLHADELLAAKDISINTGLSQGEIARAGMLHYMSLLQKTAEGHDDIVDPAAVSIKYPRVQD